VVSKAAERMLALWHALDATELGLTKQEIRRMVPGYDADNDAAFEKKFTRDKNALRDLGSSLETFNVGSGPERYRLVANEGPVVGLSLAEAAAVRLAASIWAAGDLSEDAAKAADKVTIGNGVAAASSVRKNRARTTAAPKVTPSDQPIEIPDLEALNAAHDAALIAHVPATGPLIKPLLAAIAERRWVRFSYRSGVTGKETHRLVEPWRVAFRDGGWYLLGRDVEYEGSNGSTRAFRLSRVVGEIKTATGENQFEPPAEVNVSEILGETAHAITATLALLPGRGARLRALAAPVDGAPAGLTVPEGYDLVTYRYDDEREFADELASLGPNVVVLKPAQLRAAVVNRLQAAAKLTELPAPRAGHKANRKAATEADTNNASGSNK